MASKGNKGKKGPKKGGKGTGRGRKVDRYTHPDAKRPNNPPVGLVTSGTDPDEPSTKYEYDPRLDPQLQWSGKRENAEFRVDKVSLHVHERIDPLTILEKVMKKEDGKQEIMSHYFETEDNNPPLRKAIDFYKHDQNWSNRLIAGDSLLVMNSLIEKEGMGGKVQMIYIDPPYGIKYGSNFQPYISKKKVLDGKDADLTQEPEMIKAFRDTWELNIHSYMTYIRDRLLISKKLLAESGSCIVQISIKNVCLVRLIMDEIFGTKNFVNMITVQKTTSSTSKTLDVVADYLIWYAKDIEKLKKSKYHDLYIKKEIPINDQGYKFLELKNGTRRSMTITEHNNPDNIPKDSKIFTKDHLTSASPGTRVKFEFEGEIFTPGSNYWKTSLEGLKMLAKNNRIFKSGKNRLGYIRYFNDFPYKSLNNVWIDTISRSLKKIYVVQTHPKIIERIMLMSTDPGDIVIDPTCGSGTTSFVAEKLGRRWITCDSSRIALAITKQRLMTSIFDYYKLNHPEEGLGSNFQYEIAEHITLGSIANNENPKQEIIYMEPKIDANKFRISGPFTIEAVPSPIVRSIDGLSDHQTNTTPNQRLANRQEDWRDELLKTGIRGKNKQKIEFSKIEPHPATKWLHADAENKNNSKRVIISFGPEHAPLEQRQVELAIEEAHTLVPKPDMIIFAAMQFDPEAAKDIDGLNWPGVTILKVEMNKDLLTSDLKRNRSTNESFWLVGQPDVEIEKSKSNTYIIRVKGFDYYDTKTDEIKSGDTSKIAMWMLDEDYDGRSMYPQQVFFPMDGKNGGWDKLRKTLQTQINEELINKYQGVESIPFEAGPNKRVAIKVIDDRGIESMKIVRLE